MPNVIVFDPSSVPLFTGNALVISTALVLDPSSLPLPTVLLHSYRAPGPGPGGAGGLPWGRIVTSDPCHDRPLAWCIAEEIAKALLQDEAAKKRAQQGLAAFVAAMIAVGACDGKRADLVAVALALLAWTQEE